MMSFMKNRTYKYSAGKNSPLMSWLGQDELENKNSASETKRMVSFIAYKPGYSRILLRLSNCPFLS